MEPIVYFTWHTSGYEEVGLRLEESLRKLGIFLLRLRAQKELGWQQNLLQRTQLFWDLSELNDMERRFVWIDADCEVLNYPSVFETITEDFAARKYTDKRNVKNNRLYSAGVMFFRINERTRKFFKEWYKLHKFNLENPIADDAEMSLKTVINMKYVSVFDLPPEYYASVRCQTDFSKSIVKINESGHLHHYMQ